MRTTILTFLATITLITCRAENNLLHPIPLIVSESYSPQAFTILGDKGDIASICIETESAKGVARAAADLQTDIERVTNQRPEIIDRIQSPIPTILIATVDHSSILDSLAARGEISIEDIRGKWEAFKIQTLTLADGTPLLAIAGSDRRGTIYGIYELSEQLGVSPWHWWADVAPKKRDTAYIRPGEYSSGEPKVKYRGIFINDEWPSFGGWATNHFGGLNSKMYSQMFELLLRLKANYLWPAMWDTAFNENDPLNPVVADEYGIVMGTSHHEPMMRAHKEYVWRKDSIGPWNYATNKENLDRFFREGMERNKDFDQIVTIGMRGDGDVAMSEEGDLANMKVLSDVIAGQRKILEETYGKDASEIPQLWAIFTEVQRYYDAGFTVPDDVLLLFCDNNWGYIRRTGPEKERRRKGGMGLYYHIDMNGGPWNDRWVNTTTIPKLREQLNLAYRTGIDRLWVINVGDLKPKEVPIDFIMRYAWNPDAICADDTDRYLAEWTSETFGTDNSEEIADIIRLYSKYNLRRKAEVQRADILSVVNYDEADRIEREWQALADRAETLESKITPEMRDAYFQLVLYPAKASANVAQLYIAATKNRVYAAQHRPLANFYADKVRALMKEDSILTARYNIGISDGKWKNMMLDNHIGYYQWSIPERNIMPEVKDVRIDGTPSLGICVEGTETATDENIKELILPVLDPLAQSSFHIDLFNRGNGTCKYSIKPSESWINVSSRKGSVSEEERITVTADFDKLAHGKHSGYLEISSNSDKYIIKVNAVAGTTSDFPQSFFGNFSDSEFSIPAMAYVSKSETEEGRPIDLPDLGREEGCVGLDNPLADISNISDAPKLEYNVYFPSAGERTIALGILPTQDVNPARGLRVGISVNQDTISVKDAREGFVDTFAEYTPDNLSRSLALKPLPGRNDLKLAGAGMPMRNEVFDNIRWIKCKINVPSEGFHRLKIHLIDPEIVVERIVVNPDNSRPSYLGAPTRRHRLSGKNIYVLRRCGSLPRT